MSVRHDVIRSLSRKTGWQEAEIQGDTELVASLGLDGDDAAEFFDDLRARFVTDLSALQNDWSQYFRSEPTLLSIFSRRRALVPITVEEVVQAVERGRW